MQQGSGGYPHNPRKHDEIPWKIRDKIGPLIHDCVELSNNRFALKDLAQLGGLSISRLPRLRNHVDQQGRCKICHAGLLGRCLFTDATCKWHRIPNQELPDEFVAEWIRLVGPALEKCVKELRREAASRGGNRGGNRGGQGGASNSGSRLF